jgi:cytidyltransferase-like protein
VNVIVGRFQPFHNGHLKMAQQLKKENGLPSILVVVHPGHNSSGKSPFNEDLVNKYMQSVVKDHSDVISGYFMVNRGLIGVIYGKSKQHGFIPKSFGAGDDRFDDIKKQSEYLKKAGGDFPDDIKIVQTKRSSSGTDVRKKLDSEDFIAFKKLVPPAVSSVYSQLVSSLKKRGIKESIDTNEYIDDNTNQEVEK